MTLRMWLGGGMILAATLPVAPKSSLLPQANADIYYAVEPGETLTSIAAHYKTRADILRKVNNLPTVKDGDGLASMLLRIPEKTESAPAPAAPMERDAPAILGGFGSIASAVRYQVREGDTLDSIAAGFTAQGASVTADVIRDRNRLNGEPAVGASLVIPLQSAIYRASASEPANRKTTKASTNSDIAVSDEIPVTVIERPDPVYKAPNQPRPERGSSLGSRGYYPNSGTSEGVRVLNQNEEAPNNAPRSRVIKTGAPTRTAQVAEVSESGARIRRLPQASAVTLYSCPVGTQLAVIRQNGAWSAILMSDRSTGWVPTHYLKMTDGSVDISSMAQNDAGWGGSSGYTGSYSSNNPVVQQALRWLGTPYVYGGTTRNGIDCSALVQKSFGVLGYRLPRTAAEQANVGQSVDPSNLQPGDRLYFSASGTRIDHTGLYMGNGLVVHASGRGRCVMVSSLYEPRMWNIFVGARR